VKTNLLFFILLFTGNYTSFSQTDTTNLFKITGTLKNAEEYKELEFINLTLLTLKDSSFVKSGITNNKGEFIFENIKAGNYILRIISISYKPLYRKVILNKNVNLNILLEKNDTEIDEVTITAEKELYKLETDKRIYLTANDESIQNAFAEDAIENAPGVYIDIDGNAVIRDKPATIWINGKPSKKKNENLKSFLKLLPASRIEKIEVITNLSARYTATNTNSIINIVLKKKTYDNSLTAFGTVINTANVFGLWSTLYVNKKKFDFNIYAIGSSASRKNEYYDKSYSKENEDTLFYYELDNKNLSDEKGIRLYSELNFRPNKKNEIGINVEYANFSDNEFFRSKEIRRYDNPLTKEINLLEGKPYYYNISGISFYHYFEKENHEINFNIDYYYDKTSGSDDRKELNVSGNILSRRKSNVSEISEALYFSFNYNYPFNTKMLLSVGTYMTPINSATKNKNTSIFKNEENYWVYDSILSINNKISKAEYQTYAMLSGSLLKIRYKIGIRYEYNIFDLNQTIPVFNLYKIYQNFYPSLHLSYKTKSKHSFSLSYSRRVNTPVYNLNSYIDRTNNDYISSGNPDLNFASTNSYEFSYFKRFKKINVSTSIYQKNTKNDIIKVSEPVFDSYYNKTVVLQTYANCAESKFTGTEISLSSNPVNNLRLRLYTNTYYQNLNGTYNNLPLKDKNFIYTIMFTASYKFFNNFTFKISPYYKSDKSDIFQNTESTFYTNARLKFDLWKKRFSIDIAAKDIFGTREMITEYHLNSFYHYSEKDYNFQRVQFIFIYRIGNTKYDRQAKINKLAR